MAVRRSVYVPLKGVRVMCVVQYTMHLKLNACLNSTTYYVTYDLLAVPAECLRPD